MNIPQEELDKLNDVALTDIFPQDDEPMVADSEKEEVVETVKEVKEEVSASPEEDAVADEARIPYSRFEKVNERAVRAEERLKLLEEQMSTKVEVSKEVDLPEDWVELYGDSDAAKRAYALQLKREERLEEQLMERFQQRQKEEEDLVEQNVSKIDQDLRAFEDTLGRKLLDSEESSILDIQDEFTQKDEFGNYMTPLLSPEKAYEIFVLRQEKTVSAQKKAKHRVVALTGSSNEADTDSSSNVNFEPNKWGSWRDRI